MFHILGFLFVIIIAILLIGLSIIGTVFRSIFGLGSHRSAGNHQTGSGSYQTGDYSSYNDRQNQTSREEATTGKSKNPSKRKKLFSEDEGEYVDFEEIKE